MFIICTCTRITTTCIIYVHIIHVHVHMYMYYMYFELFYYRRFVRITDGEMSYFRPEDREVGTCSSSGITMTYLYKDIPIIRI